MINIKKLLDDVGQADAERATAELDRMIHIHEKTAAMHKKALKKYLLHHARGESHAYGGSDEGRAIRYAQHSVAAAMLRELKTELEDGGELAKEENHGTH